MIKEILKPNDTRTKILAVLVFWFVFFIIEIFKKGLFGNPDNPLFLSYYLPGIFVWVFLTFPTYFIFTRSQKFSFLLRIVVFVLLGMAAGTIKTYITWNLTHLIQYNGADFESSMKRISAFYFVEAWITSWVVLILFFIKELYDKYKSERVRSLNLENQLTKAALHSLKMRLQPHFLFNAHNNIAMLVRRNKNPEAVEMISRLSDLLRLSLDYDDQQMVTVQEEIKFTKLYLDVEALRFEDTLEVIYAIDQATEKIDVPNMILQPVVENAIKHGISQHLGNSKLEISSSLTEHILKLEVKNTGPILEEGFDLKRVCNNGLGITQDRLNNQYDSASLNLRNWKHGVICEIIIPLNE